VNEEIRIFDVLYFLAEMAVYAAVVWWAVTQDSSLIVRVCLAVGGVAIFAAAWALFAAPRAPIRLPRALDAVFRIVWFGLGAGAAFAAVLHQ
jgi:hypothetical protein